MIRGVLFDLDGTLFDRDVAVRAVAEAQFTSFQRELGQAPREPFLARLLELDAHGLGDKEMVYACLGREFDLPEALVARLTMDFWARYHGFCRPYPDVMGTLQALRSRGKKLGLVTNGRASIQNGTIDALGIRHLLDSILISEVEGVRKPQRAMFERAAERLGVELSACCHVGDHPEIDVAGARAAGLGAIWRRVPHWNRPDCAPTIDNLSEILEHV